ncbi:hypothetical protein [Pseudokineococcus lusitanus]|uniref:Uncharacterized protein n=1 Tax=Pseudokineococcus lusitanus TaxID=763993 RepID=A0A3N1GWD7_9ACTN|nr:hypothetical protein [Pseudokineococcus lusitanus]ROP34570.1 hypothetical protein EDC03_2385 [Pseudokineococcus lusitanus]
MTAEWLGILSALLAVGGLVFTGMQTRHLWQQRDEDDRLAAEGVSLSWQPLQAPSRPDADGTARWVYEIVIHNPGRFPISVIDAELTFPVPVRRVHSTGQVDEPTTTLKLEQPVIHGGGDRRWKRALVMDMETARGRLNGTKGVVTFTDIQGIKRTTVWPRRPGRPVD